VTQKRVLRSSVGFVLALAAGAALVAPLTAQEWKSQYFYDESKTSLTILDLQFPSARRGVAVGYVLKGSHRTPAAVVTADGGAHWELTRPEELPVSLFFLNEGLGWMVTEGGLWKTTEAGRSWTKVGRFPKGPILQVHFADPTNGWAVGEKKTVLETHDGGAKWTPVPTAAAPPGEPTYSAYTWVAFATPQFGLIIGFNLPPRRWGPVFPDWLDPQGASSVRDVPHLNYSLETRDAGKTWKSTSASLFGNTTRIRFLSDGTGIGLVEYSQYFRLASEVYTVDWRTGKSESIYKDARFGATDVWKLPDGTAYLAGTLPLGRMRNLVPGKVQVLTSRDYKTWLAMPVDYRATANRVTLAAADDRNIWMATDTGMILKLMVPADSVE
jgi:photosystem II stability/assembly factor-like uncharacterized protein